MTTTQTYPSQNEAAWILSLRLSGIRILSIRKES